MVVDIEMMPTMMLLAEEAAGVTYMNCMKLAAMALLLGSPVVAEELRCKIRAANDVGNLVPKEALITISPNKAVYRDNITYNVHGDDIEARNKQNLSRLKFNYTVNLPLTNGSDTRAQYSVTFVKSTKIISIYVTLSGYDNQAHGIGKCR